VRYLRVKNWETFQHYKDRDPPWIKMHRTLLSDYEFSRLQDASKAHLMLIWLFASQFGGRIPDDPEFLRDKLSLKKPPDLKNLVAQGLLIPEQDASNVLQNNASNVLALARSREERREEDIKKGETEESTGSAFAPPEWIPKAVWQGFEAMRTKIRKPMTDRARKLIVGELEKLRDRGEDPIAVLEQSERNSWQDVFPLKAKNGATPDYSAVIAGIKD
jgi:hypothetical protein